MPQSRTRKRKRTPIFESWESARRNERFIRLFPSMLNSPAFLDLTHRQQMLLIRFKERHIIHVQDGMIVDSNNGELHFTKTEQLAFYGYMDSSQFSADKKALIEHGFLEVTFNGANIRQPNKYKLVDRWQRWEKDGR